MPRYVALLRGVNVGSSHRVPMATLRDLVASVGGTGVSTLLNSGNAVFTHTARSPAALARRLHEALGARLGWSVPIVVKSAAEIDAVVSDNAIAGDCDDPSRLLVVFGEDAEALRATSALAATVRPPERFHVGRHAAYLWCPAGLLQSEAARALLGRTGRAVTTRNWATVLALHARSGGG